MTTSVPTELRWTRTTPTGAPVRGDLQHRVSGRVLEFAIPLARVSELYPDMTIQVDYAPWD